jgi:uncharacterized protein YcnI
MLRRTAAVAATTAAFAAPAAADAHTSIHPNVVPRGANATLTLHVPNEEDSASTTKVAVQIPPGFVEVTADPPPGWKYTSKTEKLATPVQTDDGPVDSQVTEVDFTGGRIPPEQFGQFPLAVAIPEDAPERLTFKVVQTYSDGKVSRWIGSPTSESPAPTVATVAPHGLLLDAAGSETGPPATIPSVGGAAQRSATVTKVVKQDGGSTKTIAIAALVLAIAAVILGLVAVLRRRPAAD